MRQWSTAWFIAFAVTLLFFSPDNHTQTKDDCLICHDDPEFTTERNGKEISLYVSEDVFNSSVHGKLNCIVCHTGFDPDEEPHKENITPVRCLNCHEKDRQKHLFHPQILRGEGTESTPGTGCVTCHGNHNIQSPKKAGTKWYRTNLPKSCGKCHKEEKDKYIKSKHYEAVEQNLPFAPTCLTCHTNPVAKVHSPGDSLEVKLSQVKLCLSCHKDNPKVREKATPELSLSFILSYEKSVHGAALLGGNPSAANCVDCHTSHNVRSVTDKESTIYKENIPTTCSKCHGQIAKAYEESIHYKAVKDGVFDAPVCTDCHGEHNILKHDNPKSPVYYTKLSKEVCSKCHSSVRLAEKFGFDSDRYQTFSDSYHGLALRGGSIEVANCASCHGDHNIKPSSDPTSTVNKNNLAKTCGKCHPGANKNFTVRKVHLTKESKEEPLLGLIASIYIALIVLIIGFMLLHNAFDLYRKGKLKKLRQMGEIEEKSYGHGLYLRMTVSERIQHCIMAVSFILLVITGFMLRFPDSWWVRSIRSVFSDAFEFRSIIHRVSAVLMIGVSIYHIGYIIFTARGRKLIKDLFPKLSDFKDAIGVAKFNLGLSKEKPKLDRFSYVEKAEYWALVWGTVIMSASGIIMWFENTFIGMFTKLGWDVANVIHYYEAWLAFLAVVVWHFYFVIFNPDVYPMNLAWLKGFITEKEMEEEHPAELERIKNKLKENKNLSIDEGDIPLDSYKGNKSDFKKDY